MVQLTRRAALKAAGASTALPVLGTVASAQTPVSTVVEIPGPKVPENLAIDGEGFLYFGLTAGEVWKLTPEQTQQAGLTLDDVEQVATLPGAVIGVEVVPDGTLYVASIAGDDTGVWEVPQDGGAPALFAPITGESVFPNDVLYDDANQRLLVSESFGGAVYEVPLDDPEPEATVWVQDELLDTESFGANGLTFGPDGALMIAVTRVRNAAGVDVGRIVRVPVEDDGGAGDAVLYHEDDKLFGADGITARARSLYVAVNARNTVVRLTPTMRVLTVASADDGLAFPSDVIFGTARRQRDDLFVCNFANQTPEEGAILRTHL